MNRFIALILMVSLVGCAAPTPPSTKGPLHAISASPLAGAPARLKIGIVTFLTGDAAEPFGIPARRAAEAVIASINQGEAPAPYQRPGIAGVPIEAIYVDESGGSEKQTAELIRLYEEEGVDLIIGYISSSDCLAAAREAEARQKLLVIFDCGTSRLFEEQNYQYVFRTNAHQAIDSLGGARYLLKVRQQALGANAAAPRIAGINQNYSWGQDSWADFRNTMLQLEPATQVVEEQFPKLGAGNYTAEIEAIEQANPDVIHTSFWGADLENFVHQGEQAGLFQTSQLLMTVGESSMPQLGRRIRPGMIIGAHGPHGALAPPGELNDWLVHIYAPAQQAHPTYPVYHMAQAILGVKLAYENASRGAAGNLLPLGEHWPDQAEVIESFEYLEYPTPSGPIRLAIGNGHQAIEPAVYGTAGNYNPQSGEVNLVNVMVFPAECVNPPEGKTTEQWIREGFPGNRCP